MELREKLRKAAGLFVELPPEAPRPDEERARHGVEAHTQASETQSVPPRTIEQLVRDTEGPNLDEIHVPASAAAPQSRTDGTADFSAIYAQAGLPTAPFTAEQMLEMLASLPQELPLETRRQTMKVALSAMGKSIGATPDTIVADTSRKMAALASYTNALSQQTTHQAEAEQQEIAAMEAEITKKRQTVADAQQKLARVVQLCNAESDRLDDVLEFFSLDVPPSKHSPSARSLIG